ncbi:MAG: HIT domain-containing protein [Dehalococcoidia bacterium]|nr:HIT domain-containing protein [Dehalococcoidia bacterium]
MSDDFYCDEALSWRTPVAVVEETDTVLAFRHTRPLWPEHVVVIPKQYVASLLEVVPPLLAELLTVVQRVATDVVASRGACRVLTNLGEYQDSEHLHFHVAAGDPLVLLRS